MRIYVVNYDGQNRLVEANAASQAVMHVAQGIMSARIAKAQDVAAMMSVGAVVEKIGPAPTEVPNVG